MSDLSIDTNRYADIDIDIDMADTKTISMTLTTNSIEWLEETYPDAQSTQEAVRMAVSDARQHHVGIASLRATEDGNAVIDSLRD
jgi:hypothetical protein